MTLIRAAGFAACAFALGACAQTASYAPSPSSSAYAVSNFSKPDLQVIVKDARAERDESDGLVSAIQSEITSSLAGNTARRGKFLLTVDVIEHRSYFTYGNWNAVTRLRWKVQRTDGSIVGSGQAIGEGHRSNMLGYLTAKAVSQDAFTSAMSDLLSALSSVPPS